MTEPIEPAEVAAKLRAIARELPGDTPAEQRAARRVVAAAEVVERLEPDELEAGALPDL